VTSHYALVVSKFVNHSRACIYIYRECRCGGCTADIYSGGSQFESQSCCCLYWL